MTVFLNGQFVPEEKAVVSVFDRGFLYGDGLFEAMRVHRGEPFQWRRHLARLEQGAKVLQLRAPFAPQELRRFAAQLIEQNKMPEAVLRLVLSRGAGARGYSPKSAESPTLVMSLHPAADLTAENRTRWRLATSSLRVAANDPLAVIKTCNKLRQVLARAEAETRGADEALLLNENGEAVETAGGNIFWINHDTVRTPPLANGLLAGVTRATVLELCQKLRLAVLERSAKPADLAAAEGVFVSLSTMGIVEVSELDGIPLQQSPIAALLGAAWLRLFWNGAD